MYVRNTNKLLNLSSRRSRTAAWIKDRDGEEKERVRVESQMKSRDMRRKGEREKGEGMMMSAMKSGALRDEKFLCIQDKSAA